MGSARDLSAARLQDRVCERECVVKIVVARYLRRGRVAGA